MRKQQTYYKIEDHHVAKHLLGDVVVLLAKQHRCHGRGSDSDESAEGCGQIHKREGQSQAGNGIGADTVTYEDSIHHIVKGGRSHRYDSRDSVLFQ